MQSRWRGRGARARRPVDGRDQWPRVSWTSPASLSHGKMRSGHRVAGVGRPWECGSHTPIDDPGRYRLLPDQAVVGIPRREFPQDHHPAPIRVGEVSPLGGCGDQRDRGALVDPVSRGEGSPAAQRYLPRLLPCRLGEGVRASRQIGTDFGASPRDGHARRPSAGRPLQRRDRPGVRGEHPPAATTVRSCGRRRRSRGLGRNRLWGFRGPLHPDLGAGGRGRTGGLELLDTQLPRLPLGGEWIRARSTGLPAGLGVRRDRQLHDGGFRVAPRRGRARGRALGRYAGQEQRRGRRYRRLLPSPGGALP